jgi:GNAT superfamily N-acetyltransferase
MSGTPTEPVAELCGFDTPDHEGGTVVDMPVSGIEPAVIGRGNPTGTRVYSLLIRRGTVGPTLWWVEHPETSADPPAMTLMAFRAALVPAGTVIDQSRFRQLPLDSSDQLGAVRWWPSSGQIHQIYVAPEQRRQRIGTCLLAAAGAYVRVRDWPALWASGQRTDLGDALVTRGHPAIGARAEPRTHHLPPMTPRERAAGLPARLLEPDDPASPGAG